MLKKLAKHLAIAFLYLLFGLSLGCYYTATYFGRGGWPLPSCEALSGVLLYYLSVANAGTELQAAHWMASFVAAGYLWIGALCCVSNMIYGTTTHAETAAEKACTAGQRFTSLGSPVALTTILVSAPLPFMVLWIGDAGHGFSWSRLIAVCLRRGFVDPPIWLNYVYLALGTAALITQIAVLRRKLGAGWRRLFWTFALAGATVLVVTVGLGFLISFLLRTLFP
jgi:hypothetical protein